MIFKGATNEGQTTLFSNIILQYIEETSASVNSYTKSNIQMADTSSLTAINSNDFGQGGQEIQVSPQTINENSFIAHNPVSSNYIESTSLRRSQVLEYTVQEGDALSFIASDYGVSMNTIIWANGLKDADSISPGQTLKIPPVSGVLHNVQKGDTLALIAKKYGVEEAKIIDFNSLPQGGQISIGELIIVPDGQIKTIRQSSTTSIASIPKTSTNSRFSYLPDLKDFFMPPTGGYNWGKIHGRNGIDVANSCGTPIYAAAPGSVTVADAAGYNGGFGKFIKILHDNETETLYAHASKLLVEVGAKVEKGEKIALMGTTGRSTGCHLHFEVHGARNPLAKY